jgi:anti-sigma factor RsiW
MTAFDCDDKTLLVAYLYGEVSAAERAAMDAHLATCRACADELSALQGVRDDLGRWQPPASDLGFQVVRTPATPRSWRPPVWVPISLAAGLLLAVGAAMANVEVQTGNGGITLRAGWGHQPLSAAVAPAVQQPAAHGVAPVKTGVTDAELQKAMADLESRLRTELTATPGRQAPAAAVPVSTGSVDRGEVLQLVRSLVDESERRQQRELALRLAQVVQDWDNQRRTDLTRIEQNFGQIESVTGQEAARQRAITNYLVRASQRQ